MKDVPAGEKAFTLVEIILALGVISFCLLTLMGLFAIGLGSSHTSSVDTTVAALIWNSANELRTNSFPGSTGGPAAVTEWYDANGQYLSQGGSAPSAAYYERQVTVDTVAPPTLSAIFSAAPLAVTNAASVISYPVSAPAASRIFITNYALVSPSY